MPARSQSAKGVSASSADAAASDSTGDGHLLLFFCLLVLDRSHIPHAHRFEVFSLPQFGCQISIPTEHARFVAVKSQF